MKLNQFGVSLLTGLGLAATIPLTSLAQSSRRSNFNHTAHNVYSDQAFEDSTISLTSPPNGARNLSPGLLAQVRESSDCPPSNGARNLSPRLLPQVGESSDCPPLFECKQRGTEWYTVMNTPNGSHDLIQWDSNAGAVASNIYEVTMDSNRSLTLVALAPFLISRDNRCRTVSTRLENVRDLLLENPELLRFADVPVLLDNGQPLRDPQTDEIINAPVVCFPQNGLCEPRNAIFTLTNRDLGMRNVDLLRRRLSNPNQSGGIIRN
jgi:hypothetical protein